MSRDSKRIAQFAVSHLDQLARLLGEEVRGSELTRLFAANSIQDASGQSTKWRRILWVAVHLQSESGAGNPVLALIRQILDPVRYVDRQSEFEVVRSKVNVILAFSGIKYTQTADFRRTSKARSLSEAEQRVANIRLKFWNRALHPEVEKYCRAELMQENYFHAVFEAAKGLMERLRTITGLTSDGARLVDTVFATDKPFIVFNPLKTETERNVHAGIASLFRGLVSAVRNPAAHTPKILRESDDDAADYLALISFLHRKLDGSDRTSIEA